MKKYVVIAVLCLVCMLGTECESGAQEQMSQWQTLGTLMEQNITDTQQQLSLVTNPIDRAALQARLDKMKEVAQGFNSALDTLTVVEDPAPGDTGLAATEAILTAAAGLTGGLSLLGIPFVRLFRQRKMIFAAVDAGGGVKDPAAAKLKLVENQAAWKSLQTHQKKNGVKNGEPAKP